MVSHAFSSGQNNQAKVDNVCKGFLESASVESMDTGSTLSGPGIFLFSWENIGLRVHLQGVPSIWI